MQIKINFEKNDSWLFMSAIFLFLAIVTLLLVETQVITRDCPGVGCRPLLFGIDTRLIVFGGYLLTYPTLLVYAIRQKDKILSAVVGFVVMMFGLYFILSFFVSRHFISIDSLDSLGVYKFIMGTMLYSGGYGLVLFFAFCYYLYKKYHLLSLILFMLVLCNLYAFIKTIGMS